MTDDLIPVEISCYLNIRRFESKASCILYACIIQPLPLWLLWLRGNSLGVNWIGKWVGLIFRFGKGIISAPVVIKILSSNQWLITFWRQLSHIENENIHCKVCLSIYTINLEKECSKYVQYIIIGHHNCHLLSNRNSWSSTYIIRCYIR
jgi:hypothetical protein